jgi:preprotein translocase subunit SecD
MKIKSSLILSLITLNSVFGQFEIRDATYEPTPTYIESYYHFEGEKKKVFIDHSALITSLDVKEAFAGISGTSTYEGKTEDTYGLIIVFTESGAEKMKKLTEKRIGKSLAVMLDGKVLSVPKLMMPLSKQATITGFSKKEAEELAKKIMSHNKAG